MTDLLAATAELVGVPSLSHARGGPGRPGGRTPARLRLARRHPPRRQRGGPHVPRLPATPGAGRPSRHGPAERQRGAQTRGRHPVGHRGGRHEGRAGGDAGPGGRHAGTLDGPDLVLLCLRGGGSGRQRAVGSCGGTGPISWPETPPFWASPRGPWWRRAARAPCGCVSRCGACGPTRPAPSPAATPSIGSGPCWRRWRPGRVGSSSSTDVPTPSSSRRWRSRGEWRRTSCPTRPASP